MVVLREAECSSTVGSPPPPGPNSPPGPNLILPDPPERVHPSLLPASDIKLPLRLLFLLEPRLDPDTESDSSAFSRFRRRARMEPVSLESCRERMRFPRPVASSSSSDPEEEEGSELELEVPSFLRLPFEAPLG